MSRWEIYLAAADDDAKCAGALYDALDQAKARVFWRERQVEPGEDARAVAARALDDARIAVFVLSPSTSEAPQVRSELAAAIERFRSDPTRRIVPVYRDGGVQRGSLYGANILIELCIETDGGEAAVANKLLLALARHRAQSKVRARVAVVAVTAELSAARRAVAQRLGGLSVRPEVVEIDAADAHAFDDASKHDYRLMLIGMRTGATDALKRLAADDVDRLKASTFCDENMLENEVAAAREIRAGVRTPFARPEEAAQLAQGLFADWLKDWSKLAEGHGATLEPWEATYLRAKLEKWAKGSYGGLQARAAHRQLDRARLYVSLRAVAEPTCHASDDEGLVVLPEGAGDEHGLREGSLEAPERKKLRNPFLERILSHPGLPHLAVEGEAGSGKTVLLQHVAYALACHHLNEAAPEAQLEESGLSQGAPLLRIPILLEARRLADLLPEGELDELTEALATALRKAVDDPSIPTNAIREGLRAGRYLLLVDSLDEVPSIEARRRVLDCLSAFTQLSDCRSRLVLTSRPTAHTGVSLSASRLRLVRIAQLESEQIAQMATRWVAAMGESAEYEARLHHALGELARRHPPGAEEHSIPQNPQLLTCAFLVFDQQRLLPDSPAELFDRMVQILCDAKPCEQLPAAQKRQLLALVFECIQRAGGTQLGADQVAQAILRAQPSLTTVRRAMEVLDQLGSETGLLRFEELRDEQGVRNIVRPWHRSFEEYLCACRLAAAAGSVADETDKLVGTAETSGVLLDEGWEGVMTFLFGVYVEQGREKAQAYVERLLFHGQRLAKRRGRILGVAARCLAENPRVEVAPALRNGLRHEIAERFAEEGASWPLSDRLLALEALGRLGDPRLDADLWVEIPGGSFTMGGDAQAGEPEGRPMTVAGFRLMWRPITVQDFKAFVDDEGYAKDQWWENGRIDDACEPDEWPSQLFHPNRPVTGVSWFEAMAFCRWASGKWRLDVDLPTEAVWEFAARGPEGAILPWGEEEPGEGDHARANHSYQVGHPTPVGAFPRGNRGRLVDLAGNTWEWCRNKYEEKDAATSARGAPRVFRGGSWYGDPWSLRCAFRYRGHPDLRGLSLGFRVVCRGFRQP